MNGGLTLQELELRKQKAANLDAALDWIKGASGTEDAMKIGRILRRGLGDAKSTQPQKGQRDRRMAGVQATAKEAENALKAP
jgi:hypothetical protein